MSVTAAQAATAQPAVSPAQRPPSETQQSESAAAPASNTLNLFGVGTQVDSST